MTKNKAKVLLLEGIHEDARDFFKGKGYQVEYVKKALGKRELMKKIQQVDALGIRSKTQIDKDVAAASERLKVIGCFLIGLNKIDQRACTEQGINLFNAPFSSSRSVAELTIGLIIMLMRRLGDRNREMHAGIWKKTAQGAFEVRGKTLGIIGFGNIGSQVGILAEAMGMQVIYYDIYDKLSPGTIRKASKLEEVLKNADIVTLHVSENPGTMNLINQERLRVMKKGSHLINLSRGRVVDIGALIRSLRKGYLAGAALDVYPEEPPANEDKFRSQLQKMENVILTPHIGASTQEAQKDIAVSTSRKMHYYLTHGVTLGSVNLPEMYLDKPEKGFRLLHIHRNVPGVLSKLNAIIASEKINVNAQYLETREAVGYAAVDVSAKIKPAALKRIREMAETIRVRVV